MTQISSSKITLIGDGKVGRSLYSAMKRRGYRAELVGKGLDRQKQAVSKSDFVLLTVQDSNIERLCQQIAAFLKPNTLVAHCSGSLGCEPLIAAKHKNCKVGTAHPLATFPNVDDAVNMLSKPDHGHHCYISGEQRAHERLDALFSSLGFLTAKIEDEHKTAYHTACVFLSNYLTSLSEIGLQTAELAGLDRDVFWQAVQPLMRTTLNNISEKGTHDALSGPIVRGDNETLVAHRNFLQNSAPESIQNAYRLLGMQAIELSMQRDDYDSDEAKKVEKTLK